MDSEEGCDAMFIPGDGAEVGGGGAALAHLHTIILYSHHFNNLILKYLSLVLWY